MQILVDARLLSRGGNSGVEEYTRGLLNELFLQGKNHDFTLFYNGLNKVPLEPQLSMSGLANVKVLDMKVPNKLFDLSSRFLSYPSIDGMVKTDLVFSPHFNILAWKDAPRVMTIPDLSFIHHPQFFSWRHRFWHWLQNIKRQAALSDKIVAVSEFTKSDIVNLLGVSSERVSVIYPGISKVFHPSSAQAAARPYILYLGTIEPRKNIGLLIRAFNILKQEARFRDWQLVIAGRLGWLFDQVLREAKISPFSADIIFRGAVTNEERVSLYNLAKVFVYPSFFEGFGFPPLEAQASGCPAIVSDRTSLPEVLGDTALHVDPWKPGDLADSIRKLSEDGALRSRLVASGIENAKRFDWTNSAEQTLKLFNG